jgi:hypothetical protein
MRRLLRPLLPLFLFYGHAVLRADFIPLQMIPDSYNVDVVVEKSATAPLLPVTTASLDNGFGNTGFTFYEKGYNTNAPATGLPAPGVQFTSELTGDHDFQLAPDYKTNNAFLVNAGVTNATISLLSPTTCSRLSFLMTAGNGPATMQFIVHYQNGGTQTGTVTCPDWFNGNSGACVAHGRADVTTFAFDSVNSSTAPSLFQRDALLTTTNSPVTSVDVRWTSGANHVAVFALSAAPTLDTPFTPLALSGYSADVIIESTAARPAYLGTATSASVERGTINTGWTLYESGYYPPAAVTGLPAPGTVITNATSPDHRYSLASTYTNNNAMLLDTANPSNSFAINVPYSGAALSFLCTAANGPAVVRMLARHANGNTETNLLNIPDWLSGANPALTILGRVNLNSRFVDSSALLKFFSADVPLSDSAVVTNIALSFVSGDSNTHAYILAVSGAATNNLVIPSSLSISRIGPSTITVNSSSPGQLQSTTTLAQSNTIWRVEGAIGATTNLSFDGPARFYRVLGL